MRDVNKNYEYITAMTTQLVIVIFLIPSCAKKESVKIEEQIELISDIDSNRYHFKVMLDDKRWMTDNLNTNIPESFCQQDRELNCQQYGRLYTWEAARKGCEMLGNGWRLPTDDEWQIMAKQYGGVVDDSEDKGKSAYKNLIEGGPADFNIGLGGNREPNGEYARLDAHGFYWTATEYDSSNAWFYNFGKGSMLLNRHTGEKKRAISIRCIKELTN